MFDIGWSEMAVVALIALLVIGPKELPHTMRTVGKWVRKARAITREFQSGFNDMIREAELEEAKKALDAGKKMDLGKTIKDTIDPTGSVDKELSDVEKEAAKEAPDETAKGAKTQPLPGGKRKEPAAAEEVEETAGAAPSEKQPADQEAEAEGPVKATIIKQPLQVAPPHSLTPPPDSFSGNEGDPAGEPVRVGDTPKQSA
jgi:sec-independent protein translocase protein TatB